MAACELRPDLVAKGSQNNMKAFANIIDELYEKNPEKINEYFYKRMICYAILYRETDRIVNKAEWYNVGGYKLNIVPYSIAKLISLMPNGKCLDFNKIWRRQSLLPSIIKMIKKITYITNEYIQKTANGVIVTEHCKKNETWEKYCNFLDDIYSTDEYDLLLEDDFVSDLIDKEYWFEQEKSAKKDEKLQERVSVMVEIYKLEENKNGYWENLKKEGCKRNLLNDKEKNIMEIVSNMRKTGKNFSEAQAKVIWDARKKLENHGVII